MRGNLTLGVIGAGLGAGVMFLLDPQMGRRRRALIRDKSLSWVRQAEAAVDKTTRDVKNRTYGTIVSIKSGRAIRGRFALLNSNWPPAIRLMVGGTGGILALAGIRKTGRLGKALTIIGIGSAALAITNFSVRDLISSVSNETQMPGHRRESVKKYSEARIERRNVV